MALPHRRLLSIAALAGIASTMFIATTARADELELEKPGESIVIDHDTSTIAPGLELTTFSRLETGGWNAGAVLSADLGAEGLTLDHQYSGTVTERSTVKKMAQSAAATAAINGDFFDIDRSNAPLGVGVDREDGLVTAPIEGHNEAFAVGTDGVAHLAQIFLEGTVTAGDTELELAGVNTFELPADGIGVFTAEWGEYDRATTVPGASNRAEVVITDGVVSSVSDTPGTGPIAKNEIVLVGRDAGADALRTALEPGAAAEVSYAPRSDFGAVAVAIGGNRQLVVDGQPKDFGDTEPHARSGLGLSADGKTMFLVTIDGKIASSRGMTLTQFAQFMADIGAEQALNLDGGGSSTLVVRDPGTDDRSVVNNPSDGQERPVANGLGLFTAEGSGKLTGFNVSAGDGADQSYRVFPGLTRRLEALGHDETYAQVPADPAWKSSNPSIARIERTGDGTAILTGRNPGDVTATAHSRNVKGSADVTVLGNLEHVKPSSSLIALEGTGQEADLTLTGYDIDGYRAPIDPSDVTVTGGDGIVEVDRAGDDLVIRATSDTGSALLTLDVGGIKTQLPVTVELREEVVADFSDAADWTIKFARATGSIEPIEGPDGGSGVRMSYDFVTNAGNTRAAYATPPAQFALPGQPQAVTAQVEGDGNGTWIRMRVYDGNGTLVTLDGGYTDYTGWQEMTFEVPAGTQYPLTFRDIYAVQVGDPAYNGTTGFADIAVKIAPDVEQPERKNFPDPVLVTNGTVDGSPQRIAVMSDSQFVAADPDSDIVAAARRTLREIVAADPDVLVINGDFVDEASPEDFALSRQVLDEELAGVSFPWYYVPGNHEIQGGPIGNFIAEFGATQYTVDYGGTRIITLNSSTGKLGSDFSQVEELRRALNEAAEASDITGVLVFAHHPPNDPLPSDHSQLIDRQEAAMVEKWLADFESSSGKSAAYVGAHAGVFHAESVDGVPFLVNGNSGKSPADVPEFGGFTGWTMLGLDPSAGESGSTDWLQAEVRARVDTLNLSAPASLSVGDEGAVAATVEQDDVRTVPVSWPVAAQWAGEGVHVGAPDDAPRRAIVAVDPAAGTITALRPGSAELSVTVNGETATQPITVH